MRSLRFRLALWSGLVAGLGLAVFVAAATLQLQFAAKRTLDEQMADFAADILAQLSVKAQKTRAGDLPELLALFDDNNIIRVARIRSVDGRRLFTSADYLPLVYQRDEGGEPLQTAWSRGHTWRVGRYNGGGFELDLVADLGEVDSFVRELALAAALALPLTFVAVALGSTWVSKRALAPLRRVTDMARSITARELDRRIPETETATEILQLVHVLNGMMDRLERSFTQATRFSADAAHELRTPLTVIQGVLERALTDRSGRGLPEQDAATLLDETQRLIAIVERLLLLSKADAGRLQLSVTRFDLSRLVRAAEEDLRVLAAGQDLAVEAWVAPGVHYSGDEPLLAQAVINLFSNAVAHNRPGGVVRLSLQAANGAVALEVFNTGEPIPATQAERVFDRFFRGDASRNRAKGGSGLGLSLAREIVRAHGGELALVSSSDEGTTFAVRLPLPPPRGAA